MGYIDSVDFGRLLAVETSSADFTRTNAGIWASAGLCENWKAVLS